MTPITMTRRTFGGLSALLLAGLAGCGRENPGSGGSSEVTYQLSWTHSVQFGGTYIAQDRGLFEDLTVRLAAGGPNVAGDANTVSGAALMNISSADGVARSNAEGADLVITVADDGIGPPSRGGSSTARPTPSAPKRPTVCSSRAICASIRTPGRTWRCGP